MYARWYTLIGYSWYEALRPESNELSLESATVHFTGSSIDFTGSFIGTLPPSQDEYTSSFEEFTLYEGKDGTLYEESTIPPTDVGVYLVTYIRYNAYIHLAPVPGELPTFYPLRPYVQYTDVHYKTATLTIVEDDLQPMAFTDASVTKTYGDTNFTNVATHTASDNDVINGGIGTRGAISYTSSDSNVATVNTATGEVQVVGAGIVVITATAASVPGKWAEDTVSYTLTVNKKLPSVDDLNFAIPTDHIYTGLVQGIGDLTAKSTVTGFGALTVEYDDSEISPRDAGIYAVRAVVTEGANYMAATLLLGSYTIAKADYTPIPAAATVYIHANESKTFTLANILPVPQGWTYTTVAGDLQTTLTLNLSTSGIASVTLKHMNYNDLTVAITVTVTEKTIVEINEEIALDKRYDSRAVTYVNNGGYTLTWQDGEAPIQAGYYALTLSKTADDENVYQPQTVFFNISKAPLTVKADDKSITSGSALPAFTATQTPSALLGTDSWTIPYSVSSPTANANVAGTYLILITPGELSCPQNYDVTYTNGTLTVTNPSGSNSPGAGGGGGTVAPDKKPELPTLPTEITGKNATVTVPGSSTIDENSIITIGASGAHVALENGLVLTIKEGVKIKADKDAPFGYVVVEIPGFIDVPASVWYAKNIDFASTYGLMNGTGNNRFSPDTSLNRAMFVEILYRLMGKPKVTTASPFEDVNANAYYADAVAWAAGLGIVNGKSAVTFAPNDNVTRQDLTVLLHRFAETHGFELLAMHEYAKFNDESDISSYALDAVKALYAAGIINGKSGDKFDPKGNSTRAEAAAMLERFTSALAKED
ncbi:MAG: S-layer homology domain-containing protein [Oscillospiraceae bacterium]|nr:S-layer homology domain-containing protein [Oscillospiraceae bacterium]